MIGDSECLERIIADFLGLSMEWMTLIQHFVIDLSVDEIREYAMIKKFSPA